MKTNFWQNLKKPIIGLAPMDGITDFPMRKIQTKISKPDVFYTEFVSTEGYIRKPLLFNDTLFFEENQRPIVAQVFGHTPDSFAQTIEGILQLDFDGIDLNMGCPAKSIMQKGGGGALIGNYFLSEKIILASLKAIKKSKKEIPLSVKTRIGIDKPITKEWFSFLSKFPIDEVSIHGRLLKNGHKGENNWEEIQKAAQILKAKNIICLGNGGIKNLIEAKEITEKYQLDGILIGQAALGNPWLFKGNYQPTKEEILKTILKHAQYVDKFYPPKKFVTVLKHFSWYPKYFKNNKQLKIELLKTRNLKEVKQVLAKFE